MSDALALCGVRNVFGDLKELGPVINTEAVIARNPRHYRGGGAADRRGELAR